MSSPTPSPLPPRDVSAERWFVDEVHRHDSSLRAYVRSSFPSFREVEDVLQESYLRIWRRRTLGPMRMTKTFLIRTVRHLTIDWLRREKISPTVAVAEVDAIEVEDGSRCVAESAAVNEELVILAQAIHALPNRCREVVTLRLLQGVSQKEIAVRLGLSELTVQTHVVHGLRKLERYFQRCRVKERPR